MSRSTPTSSRICPPGGPGGQPRGFPEVLLRFPRDRGWKKRTKSRSGSTSFRPEPTRGRTRKLVDLCLRHQIEVYRAAGSVLRSAGSQILFRPRLEAAPVPRRELHHSSQAAAEAPSQGTLRARSEARGEVPEGSEGGHAAQREAGNEGAEGAAVVLRHHCLVPARDLRPCRRGVLRGNNQTSRRNRWSGNPRNRTGRGLSEARPRRPTFSLTPPMRGRSCAASSCRTVTTSP